MNYQYYMPTRAIIGEDCILNHSDVFKTLGKRAMLVTGARSAKLNGSAKDIMSALEAVGITYLVYDKVMSNPTVACAYEGAALAKANDVDFIIAIGGGSPMDAGKAIALLAAQDIEPSALFSGKYENKVLPIVAVPTTAGTGSEVTQYSILTNDAMQTKTGIASNYIFPAIAFLDSKYMEALSYTTLVNTAVDALSHAVEGMLSVRRSFISDALAMESIRSIMETLKAIAGMGDDVKMTSEMRDKLLYASFMAGIVIAQTGTTVVHAMGYALTYSKGIDHGKANGLLMGSYLKLVSKQDSDLADKIVSVMGYDSIESMDKLILPMIGEGVHLSEDEIEHYTQKVLKTSNVLNCLVKPAKEDIMNMYQEALNAM
ncbi:iron-containing alcohol dehydrogenase [Fusibacter paucivorans]|uniref:Iron-containing alcohol dehydrogenase n=1 Tax=Fusibacter paucivorans TaxID=76009 RepID=A0ABS5PLG0_9FIRM|nr:iron-containing alcohol dehydrogenase family protein [Fusibacter paucivorans]MBS7525995.1 iron-containing alcohol dehydrogenase [Fusibacter paucivorans]